MVGSKGEPGLDGAVGPVGPPGSKGERGERGPPGAIIMPEGNEHIVTVKVNYLKLSKIDFILLIVIGRKR